MPSDDSTISWMVGMDLLPGVREKLPDFCGQIGALICCEELGTQTEKPHVHILVIFPEPVSRITFRNRIKRYFDIKFGKSELYLTQWTTCGKDKGLEEYVCKGPSTTLQTPPIVIYKNWIEDEQEHHKNWWTKHKELEAKPSKKKNVNTTQDFINETITNFNHDKTVCDLPEPELFEYTTLYVVRKYKAKINDNILFPIIQSIVWNFHPKPIEREIHLRMLRKKSNY